MISISVQKNPLPVFDSATQFVGWFDGKYLFGIDREWTAFVWRNNTYSAALKWLGPFSDGCFLDTDGKPVAWITGSKPEGTSIIPVRPEPFPTTQRMPKKLPWRPTPNHPHAPLEPVHGWSKLSIQEWLSPRE
jgi:hypothetical protein